MRLLVIALCVFFSACATVNVSTDYDMAYDFSSLGSYAWLKPKEKVLTDPYVDNDLMRQRVKRAVDGAMEAKGLRLVAEQSIADVLVSYHLSSHQKLSISKYHSYFGYYPCRFCYPGGIHDHGHNVDVRQYRAGSFIVDIIDPETRALVWRGVSERRLPQSATPEERDAFVNEIITAILQKFPAK